MRRTSICRVRHFVLGDHADGQRSEKCTSVCPIQAIRSVFEAVQPAGLKIATKVVPLSEVEEVWDKAAGKPRVVFSIEQPLH